MAMVIGPARATPAAQIPAVPVALPRPSVPANCVKMPGILCRLKTAIASLTKDVTWTC
jgi:hypothetical protein